MFSGGIQPGDQGYGFRRQPVKPSGPAPSYREGAPPGSAGVPLASFFLLAGKRYMKNDEGPRSGVEFLQWHAPPQGRRIINIDAQDAQDFSGYGQLVNLGIREPAPDHCPSRLLVQQPFVLLILCILFIHVQKNVDPLRRSRPIQVAEMGKAVPAIVRAGRPRSRVASSHDLATPRSRSSPDSASRAAASRPANPVHPVHRCSIDSPSRWICPVAGSARLPPASWSVR